MAQKVLRLVIVFLLTLGFSGCSEPHEEHNETMTVSHVDDLGRVVRLAKRPQRIVSLAPNVTEIIFFLGEGNRLVGVTRFCNWPPDAARLPRVGDFSNPSIERIVELSPDLVLTTSLEQDRWIGKLSSLGIPVYTVYPHDCTELMQSMKNLLDLLGATPAGLDSIRVLSERLDSFERSRKLETTDRPSVFIEISNNPLMTAGTGSFVSDLIERAGGRNIANGLERDYCVINPERVIKSNPDVVFLFHGLSSRDELSRRIGWGSIKAVKNHRVYDDVNLDLVLRPGPRAVLGIEEIEERIGARD